MPTIRPARPTAARPSPLLSEGARLERKAVRAYLRRQRRLAQHPEAQLWLELALDWVLTRQQRYNTKVGGLGTRALR
jgi:hypothetical protein